MTSQRCMCAHACTCARDAACAYAPGMRGGERDIVRRGRGGKKGMEEDKGNRQNIGPQHM